MIRNFYLTPTLSAGALKVANTQSGSRSYGNEGILHIPQSSGTDRKNVGWSFYFSVEVQSTYSTIGLNRNVLERFLLWVGVENG